MKTVTLPPTAAQQRALDADGNATVQALMAATPAEVAAYMSTHVTTIAQAQAMFTALALALRSLYLRDKTT